MTITDLNRYIVIQNFGSIEICYIALFHFSLSNL
jgi:hypothetical protein